MDISVIILILIGVIIIFFATRFLGKAMKSAVSLLLLVIVVLALLTILVYKDMTDIKMGFKEKNNTFLLYENNKLYTAITLKPMNSTELGIDSFYYYTGDEIKKMEEELAQKNYSAVLGQNYKMFIIKPIVVNKPYTLNLGIDFSEGDLLNMMMSNDPFTLLAEKTNSTYGMGVEELKKGFQDYYVSDEKFKGYLFAGLLSNYFQNQNPGELVNDIKDKRIMVYPDTISFKVIKYLPWV